MKEEAVLRGEGQAPLPEGQHLAARGRGGRLGGSQWELVGGFSRKRGIHPALTLEVETPPEATLPLFPRQRV